MKTSIVIPVINDDFVYTCLNSLLNQFNNKIPKDKEIMVVNDKKSLEDFSKILKEFCIHKKIKFIQAEKPGASFNRNLGMKISKGKNILFIDSDCRSGKNWVVEMEKSLEKFDLVEGRVNYDSKKKFLLDRVVENKNTPNRFLTANLGIKRKVADSVKFDDRFIVFREDTDFGLTALEKGFSSTFNNDAVAFHKASKFKIKRFITERKRYIGEPLLFKKHKSNPLLKEHINHIGRIVYPLELAVLFLFFISLFFNPLISLIIYFIPGAMYNLKGYFLQGRSFSFKDTVLTLILISLTMFVKRIYIWKGALKFKFFVI